MKKKRLGKIQGFTILELLVAMGVFSLMMALFGAILIGGQNQVRLNDMKMNLQTSVRNSLTQMSLEIRESSASRVTVGSGGSTLTFQIPSSVGNSGTITWSSPITYQVGGNGRQLMRVDGNGNTTILANDVQASNFAFVDANTLVYSVTAQRTTVDGRTVSTTLTGDARFRNP